MGTTANAVSLSSSRHVGRATARTSAPSEGEENAHEVKCAEDQLVAPDQPHWQEDVEVLAPLIAETR